jgi:hypothetical protein
MHTIRYVSVADPGTLIRMFSIPDLESVFFPSRIRIKEFKYFNPKNWFLCSRNMIRVVNPGSGSCFFSHPGSRGQKGTEFRIRNTAVHLSYGGLCALLEA